MMAVIFTADSSSRLMGGLNFHHGTRCRPWEEESIPSILGLLAKKLGSLGSPVTRCLTYQDASKRERFSAPCSFSVHSLQLFRLPTSYFRPLSFLPTLAIPTIQTRSAPIHQDDGIGVALVAHRRAGRERVGGFGF